MIPFLCILYSDVGGGGLTDVGGGRVVSSDVGDRGETETKTETNI